MYLSRITIDGFRCFGEGEGCFELFLMPGLTAFVGENDAGKTAVIDALRFVLGTTDQDWYRLEDTDFHEGATSHEIKIVCKFEDLNGSDKRAFVEYLTYEDEEKPVLYINWTCKDTGETRKGRPYRPVETRSGKNGDGPVLELEARELLRATYLRPLRDADQALSAGRGSRLSQVLRQTKLIDEGDCVRYDGGDARDPAAARNEPRSTGQAQSAEQQQQGPAGTQEIDKYLHRLAAPGVDVKECLKGLSVLGIGELTNALLENQRGIAAARSEVDKHLRMLDLVDDRIRSTIKVSGVAATEEARLRQLLEKLDLSLGGSGRLGLGSNNLLFMACELLLLSRQDEGYKLVLIEEPEAHLHAQRQLSVMKFMQEQAMARGIQIIVTTHSPNLASAIKLDNMVVIHKGRAFPLAERQTKLESSDYRFLERFLDVTKANLFFARGVLIVEGDAENILLPTLARLIGRDLTERGVSIVNVGGTGLRRYARIFQRRDVRDDERDRQLDIPVACITDMDVIPDYAEAITGKCLPTKGSLGPAGLVARRAALCAKTTGQMVKTFVSDEWTLEYDLAFSGLAEDVFVAARLAKRDEALAKRGEDFSEEIKQGEVTSALAAFKDHSREAKRIVAASAAGSCTQQEVLAATVYAEFTKGTMASKAIAAQYLAERLQEKCARGGLTGAQLRGLLPAYLMDAIDCVTGADARKHPPGKEGRVSG